MNSSININQETLEGISNFVDLDSKENILTSIDFVIEYNLKSDIAGEFNLTHELGLLFDIKRLINCLPFSKA